MLPLGMDDSGLSPLLLKRLIDACVRLPYREALAHLACWSVKLSLNKTERVLQGYGEVFTSKSWDRLKELAKQTLPQGEGSRVVVVQADGCIVTERDKPESGLFQGREVKQVAIYPEASPSQRCNFATALPKDDFEPAVHGLLRQVAQQNDVLIGIADGAKWIDDIFTNLGIDLRILDVYHACDYLDTVMLALGFDESTREQQRRDWYRGDCNARDWLTEHLPEPEIWLTWSEDALTALSYLEARLEQMDYADFKAKDYPIGSGQIEGLNKSLIAARMKRSGMFWSHDGINAMAALRSAQFSHRPLADFHQTRLVAFNPV